VDENGSVALISAITAVAAMLEVALSSGEVPAIVSGFGIAALVVALLVLVWRNGRPT
jgi:hypothetical protein